MPMVHIPSLMRELSGGNATVEVQGATVRQVIESLDMAYPGIKERLCAGDRLRPGLAVAVDGTIAAEGMRRKLSPQSEVRFLPGISGG